MSDFLRRTYWTRTDRMAASVGVLFVVWVLTPWIFPASGFITIHEVELDDAYVGTPVPLHAERTLHLETDNAYYEVDVIDVTRVTRACYAKRAVPYNVNTKSKIGVRSAVSRDLGWWAYSNDGDCDKWVRAPGEYYVKTRHCYKRFWWTRTACNPWHTSNVFTLY